MATTETNATKLNPDADRNQQPQSMLPARQNGRWSGYRHLLWARILELKREPEVVFWVFIFPLLLAAGLGIAFRNKPADITSVVAIESNPDGSYTYYYDPARPESVLSRAEIDSTLQSAAGRKDALATSAQSSSEPGSRYIDFLIPGLLGMNLMNSGMWGVGFALVEMRQRKLLKRFVATPMRRSDFLLALTSSRLILMVIEVGLLLSFGVLVFHMPLQGSIVSVILLGSLGAITFGGVGLLTACRAQKIESVSGLINLVMMPMWIFSGVFFSYDRFPAIAHPFIKALPLTALNDALRATIIEGATLGSQSGRLLVLAIWGGVSFILALRWFRWT
jgi:ABC-type multidrug transport system permease subunit